MPIQPTRAESRAREFIQNAEVENRMRFRNAFTATPSDGTTRQSLVNHETFYHEPLKALQDGQSVRLPLDPQNPGYKYDYYDVKENGLGRLLGFEVNKALEFGDEDFNSIARNGFVATRNGNQITITGIVEHVSHDPYDFTKGPSSTLPSIARDHGSAKEYDVSSSWEQEMTITYKIENGNLILQQETWRDLK